MTPRPRIVIFSLLVCGSVLACATAAQLTAAHDLASLSSAYVLMWLLMFAAFLLLPHGLSPKHTVLLILLASLLTRLAMLPLAPSDDINRYLWEGRVLAAGHNPYLLAPDAPELAHIAETDPWHAGINHPDMTAAYPPLMIGMFSALSCLAYRPISVKVVVISADLIAVLCLLGILHDRRLPLRWAILYALNPLVLFGFAGEGHFDSLQTAFLIGALWCHGRHKWHWMFLLIGLAIQVKYAAVLALPFILTRRNWRHAWITPVICLVPYLPLFAIQHGQGFFKCLFTFGTQFAFNGPIHGLLRHVTGSLSLATSITTPILFAALLLGGVALNPLWNRRVAGDPLPGILFVLSAALLLSPTLHYWYLAWVLPLAVMTPSWGWIAASLTAVAYFTVPHHDAMTGTWGISPQASAIEWAPVLTLLAWEAGSSIQRFIRGGFSLDSKDLSVIIPTLNEADHIADCCAALRSATPVPQILVSDGGSTDETVDRAKRSGATVIQQEPASIPGRGGQIQAALQHATGDVVAIVHADTRVPAAAWPRILELLQRNPLVIGGSLGSRFTGSELTTVETLNDFRAACLGISFGDQVQFFRRKAVAENRLFPAIPLMEDVELSLRLRSLGRVVHLFGDAEVSDRSWRGGKWSRAMFVGRLVSVYLCKRMLGPVDTRAMYSRYYPAPH